LEGKQWWIVNTLPIRAKELLDSKLLMNLTVTGPFCLIASLLVVIGQKADIMEATWIFLVPIVAMLFSVVFGQTVNLKLAVFDWENEVSIVKQSASAFVGGIVPFFVMMPLTMGTMMIPAKYLNVCMFAFCVVIGIITVLLYRKNSKVNLLDI
jgi:ABC-2 type transport system permease protein